MVVVTCTGNALHAMPDSMDLLIRDRSLEMKVLNLRRGSLSAREIARLRRGDLLDFSHHVEMTPHPHTLHSLMMPDSIAWKAIPCQREDTVESPTLSGCQISVSNFGIRARNAS
jgi:hypothetical protein